MMNVKKMNKFVLSFDLSLGAINVQNYSIHDPNV